MLPPAVIYRTHILPNRHLPHNCTPKPSFTVQMHSQTVIYRINVLPRRELPHKKTLPSRNLPHKYIINSWFSHKRIPLCSTAVTNIPLKIALSCLILLHSVIKSRRDSKSIFFALITCSETCSRISHCVKSIACLSSSVQRNLHHHCSRHFIPVWPLSAVIYHTNVLQSRHLPYKYSRKPSFTTQMYSQAVIHRTNVLPSSHLPYKCISKPTLTAKIYSQTVIYK